MPTGKREPKTYLSITYGKFRQSSTKDDEEAVSRMNKDDKEVWERVFDWIEGKITKIYYKEDDEFGNSFEVTIDDGAEKFNLSFKEDSRYCSDLLSKLPNIDLNQDVKLVPYDFQPKDSPSARKGLTIWQNNAKIENYFVNKEGDKFIYKHGFPESDGKMEKDDFKIYMIKVKKFLRTYTQQNIIPKMEHTFVSKLAEDIDEHNDDSDSLPF